MKTNLSCGTTLNVDAMNDPLPVTRTIYRYLNEKTVAKNLFWQKLYFFIVFSLPKNTADACKALIRLTVETPMQKKKLNLIRLCPVMLHPVFFVHEYIICIVFWK